MVEWDEIEKNDYNLNIPRYIQPVDKEIQHDIKAHLHGGLPAFDIDKMDDYWEACPSLKVSLFNDLGNGYYDLKVSQADIATAIENDPSYQTQGKAFSEMLNDWRNSVQPQMMSVCKGARPKELIANWSETLLMKAISHRGLVDPYEVYDVLLNYWADVMQDDCYMVANDGWTYPEVKAVKRKETTNKKTNKTEVKETACLYDEIVCDLLPVNILLSEFFTTETDEIADLQNQIEGKQSVMDAIVEQNTDAFIFGDDESNDDSEIKVKVADVKKAIKNAKNNSIPEADVKVWKQWLTLSNEMDELYMLLKQKRSDLTDAVVEKYATLSENEIKTLVVERKWLDNVLNSCNALMQTVTHSIANDTTALVERYKDTLVSLDDDVAKYEAEVNDYLKEMGFEL
jgi:type I restriction enzyme M protein